MAYKISYNGNIYESNSAFKNSGYQIVPTVDLSGYQKLGNYVSATTFNFFSGTTAPNTYLKKTNFNLYTGTTNSRLSAIESGYITGATNLGNGKGLFTSVAGHKAQFKSLVAGSNITLTPTSTGVTISSTASGGGGITGATNGLHITGGGRRIGLGGALTGDTTIAGTTLNFDLGSLNINTAGTSNLTFTDGLGDGVLNVQTDAMNLNAAALNLTIPLISATIPMQMTGDVTLLTDSHVLSISLSNDNGTINLQDTLTGGGTGLFLSQQNGAGSFLLFGGTNLSGTGAGYLCFDLDGVSSSFAGVSFQDTRPVAKGIEYQSDYSLGFSLRSLVDKGYVTGLTQSAPSNITTDVKIQTVGKGFYVKEGANATSGIITLTGGTATVFTNKVDTNSRIQLTAQNTNSPKALAVSARANGTSFTIRSSDNTDTSQVAWIIFQKI